MKQKPKSVDRNSKIFEYASTVNRTRTLRLEGGDPNHWTIEALRSVIPKYYILC